jgi:hypothetical protein
MMEFKISIRSFSFCRRTRKLSARSTVSSTVSSMVSMETKGKPRRSAATSTYAAPMNTSAPPPTSGGELQQIVSVVIRDGDMYGKVRSNAYDLVIGEKRSSKPTMPIF